MRSRGGHEQLEQELTLALVQPVGELLELGALLAVALGVAVGVVAHQHLREVRVEALDVLAELLPILEVEQLLARALGGHRQPQALRAGLLGNGRAELLVHQHPRHRRVGARGHRLLHALEDEVLGVGDHRRLLGIGFALDAEELLLEGAAVVEREDVELLVVAELGHARTLPPSGRGGKPQVCSGGSRGSVRAICAPLPLALRRPGISPAIASGETSGGP